MQQKIENNQTIQLPTQLIKQQQTSKYFISEKDKQRSSFLLRVLLLSRILINNFKFSIVFKRYKRFSTKSLCHNTIDKIIDEQGNILFDETRLLKQSQNNKNNFQREAIETVLNELEKRGYVFGKLQSKTTQRKMKSQNSKTTMNGNEMNNDESNLQIKQYKNEMTTMMKITTIQYGEMKCLLSEFEESIGMDLYDILWSIFETQRFVENVVVGHSIGIERMFTALTERGYIPKRQSMFVGECYESIESVYLQKSQNDKNNSRNEIGIYPSIIQNENKTPINVSSTNSNEMKNVNPSETKQNDQTVKSTHEESNDNNNNHEMKENEIQETIQNNSSETIEEDFH